MASLLQGILFTIIGNTIQPGLLYIIKELRHKSPRIEVINKRAHEVINKRAHEVINKRAHEDRAILAFCYVA
jgi:NADH dehydrogenase FAD-containing subunit